MTTLLIVESPKKAKTIQKLLGEDFVVMASYGHFRDLPEHELGIDTDTFQLKYEFTEKGRLKFVTIKAAMKKCSQVILGTDLDREGEAIAWHLATMLGLKSPKRIRFNEITKAALEKAIFTSEKINYHLVNAQQARRGIDRMIGYRLSRPLSTKLSHKGLSTGRVQFAAQALLVEQEALIRTHVSREHYTVELQFHNDERQWSARWMIPESVRAQVELQGNAQTNYEQPKPICLDKAIAQAAVSVSSVRVLDYTREQSTRMPPPPLITSTMQQQASMRWGYDPDVTMTAAQSLYDSGHITYHRTDVPNLAEEAILAIHQLAAKLGLPFPDKPNKWPTPPGAQEAHEAIRPANMELEDVGETEQERNLYRLIRLRALQSQLAPAHYDVQELLLEDEAGQFQYKASGRQLVDPGYLRFARISGAGQSDNPDEESDEDTPLPTLPALNAGDLVAVDDSTMSRHKTQPPRRYTVASLMRKLEKLGIGRPATYATIFSTLSRRGYSKKEGGYLVPSQICELIYQVIYPNFSYSFLSYTRDMEAALDSIAKGELNHVALMRESWNILSEEEQGFVTVPRPAGIEDPADSPTKDCPKCGRVMRAINGRYGKFWSCSGYAENKACEHTEKFDPAVISINK
ncbi:type I DNA topoisomerase, partial [Chromobacterium piscinae]